MTGRLRRRVFEILQIPSAPNDVQGKLFDVVIVSLIILNTVAVVVETVDAVQARWGVWLRAFELFSVTVFIAEYALRVWSITADPRYEHPVEGRLRWMASPFAIIDVIAILPAFIGVDLRFVRVLRVMRVLKLGRYAESVQILGNVMRRSRADLLTSLFLVFLALILTSSFVYYAEKDAQPVAFDSIPRAMWWSVITLTTVGYGDVVPVTALGRVLGGMTALLGVASIALPIGILSSAFVQEIENRRKRNVMSPVALAAAVNGEIEARHKRQRTCPHCGEKLR